MAIYTDTHVVTMPHKCATTYVMRTLKSAFGAKQAVNDRHAPLARIPEEILAGRRVLGIVRNPFQWYVSRWWYVKSTMQSDLPEFEECLKKNILRVDGVFGNKPPDVIDPPRIGSFTWQHVMYHSSRFEEFCLGSSLSSVLDVDRMMRVESIRADLIEEFGEKVVACLNQFRNSHVRGDWRKHHTERTVRIISEMDGDLASHYGYEPPL